MALPVINSNTSAELTRLSLRSAWKGVESSAWQNSLPNGLAGDSLAKRRLVVIAGGSSAEREISLASGRAVLTALRIRGHHVVWLDPAETTPSDFAWQPRDVACLLLHGEGGEDGRLQAWLEQRQIPHTGSSSAASELAFSKRASKARWQQSEVPTPLGVEIHEADSAERIHRLACSVGFPLVVKPDQQGSSLGVSIVEHIDDLPQALAECFHYGAFGLLETFVAGTEWTVSLLDDDPLPPVRIEPREPFYNFAAKYEDGRTRYITQPEMPNRVRLHLLRVSQRAAAVLGCRGLTRVDLRLDRHLEPWVLEVNTIPGMTDQSLAPKAASEAGIDFETLCEWLAAAACRAEDHQSAAA